MHTATLLPAPRGSRRSPLSRDPLPALKPSILIADDEPDVLKMVNASFSAAGFNVISASDGTIALAEVRRQMPALVVLDIMMPGLSGIEVTRALKRDVVTAGIPIVLLSARSEEANRILGFELGIDDFVAKPFSPRELVLRARTILKGRAPVVTEEKRFAIGHIDVDQERHVALVDGQRVALTAIEFKLLLTLAREARRVISRDDLVSRIWGDETEIDTRTVDTHVRRLRDKLGAAGDQIQTVRGFGYRLDDAS
jgi:two-component system phosphate regulon response regulator PhoB